MSYKKKTEVEVLPVVDLFPESPKQKWATQEVNRDTSSRALLVVYMYVYNIDMLAISSQQSRSKI